MKVLIDTCVVLDYLENREPFFDDALNLMITAANGEVDACITASSATDLFYIIHRKLHDNERSREVMKRLTRFLSVIDTEAKDCIMAQESGVSDYEDAVMIESAGRTNMEYIITRNEKDYAASSVPVISPAAFLDHLEQEYN